MGSMVGKEMWYWGESAIDIEIEIEIVGLENVR